MKLTIEFDPKSKAPTKGEDYIRAVKTSAEMIAWALEAAPIKLAHSNDRHFFVTIITEV